MFITVNGKREEIGQLSLLELLNHRNIIPERVVLELNGEIIQPDAFETRLLNDGDVLEIVQFVGGG